MAWGLTPDEWSEQSEEAQAFMVSHYVGLKERQAGDGGQVSLQDLKKDLPPEARRYL